MSTDNIETYVTPDVDGVCDVELTESDKALILRLAIFEYFGEEQGSEISKSVYKCRQNCTVCSENKLHFPIDERLLDKIFVDRSKGEFLSKEDKEAICKDLVHDFFKFKWEADNEKNKIDIKKEKRAILASTGEDRNSDKVHAVETQSKIEMKVSEMESDEMKGIKNLCKDTIFLKGKKMIYQLVANTQTKNGNDKPCVMESNTVKKTITMEEVKQRSDANSLIENNLSTKESDECHDIRYKNTKNDTQPKIPNRIQWTETTRDYNQKGKQNTYECNRNGRGEKTSEWNQSRRSSTHRYLNQESNDDSEEYRFRTTERNNSQALSRRRVYRNQSPDFSEKRPMDKESNDDSEEDRFRTPEINNSQALSRRIGHRNQPPDFSEKRLIDKESNDYSEEDRFRTPERNNSQALSRRIGHRNQPPDFSEKRLMHKESNDDSEEERFRTPERNNTQDLSRQIGHRNQPPDLSEKRPMDDPESKFYIDRKWIDVKMYEKGLRDEKWNPTQSLYEIGTKCGWTRPEYTVTRVSSNINFPRFICEGIVNGELFTTDHGVPQKKLAQHLASTKILNYIGFDFRCPNYRHPPVTEFAPRPLPGSCRAVKFSLQMSSGSWSLEGIREHPCSLPKRSKK